MTDQSRKEGAPDVEEIIADIKRNISEAGEAFTRPRPVGPEVEPDQSALPPPPGNLYEIVRAVNTTWGVGKLPPDSAVKGMVRRRLYAALIPLIDEINEHDSQVVRAINKIVGVLDGLDTKTACELLIKTDRRIDLMAQFCNRLSEYDDLKVDERLKALEEKVDRLLARQETK